MKVIEYRTGDNLDFTEELDKIWWDHLADDPSYQVSMVNTDVLDDPTIRNAYSFQVKGDRIYYSIITSAPFKRNIHEYYERVVLRQNVYDFHIIDEHTYSVRYYPYAAGHLVLPDMIDLIRYQIQLFRMLPATHQVKIDVLDEWVYKALDHIEANRTYPFLLRWWYNRYKHRIWIEQSFAQGNCQIGRIQQSEGIVFFDYFGVYERPAYLSWMLDLATFLVSVSENPDGIPFVVRTLNEYPHEKDAIIFLALLQEECHDNPFFQSLWLRNCNNQEIQNCT